MAFVGMTACSSTNERLLVPIQYETVASQGPAWDGATSCGARIATQPLSATAILNGSAGLQLSRPGCAASWGSFMCETSTIIDGLQQRVDKRADRQHFFRKSGGFALGVAGGAVLTACGDDDDIAEAFKPTKVEILSSA